MSPLEHQCSRLEARHLLISQPLGLQMCLHAISFNSTLLSTIHLPTLSAGRGLMSKISMPCIFPRISRRSRPVACSRSVGMLPGAAPGGRRSSCDLISDSGNHDQPISSRFKPQQAAQAPCSVPGSCSPSNAINFPSGSPGFGSHFVTSFTAILLALSFATEIRSRAAFGSHGRYRVSLTYIEE